MWSAWSVVMPGWMPGRSGDNCVPPPKRPPILSQVASPTAGSAGMCCCCSRPASENLLDTSADSGTTRRKPLHSPSISDVGFDFSDATDEAPHEDSVVRVPAAHIHVIVRSPRCANARKTSSRCAPRFSVLARSLSCDFRFIRHMCVRHRSAAEVRRRVRRLPGRVFEPDLLLHDRVRPPDHPRSKSGELKI